MWSSRICWQSAFTSTSWNGWSVHPIADSQFVRDNQLTKSYRKIWISGGQYLLATSFNFFLINDNVNWLQHFWKDQQLQRDFANLPCFKGGRREVTAVCIGSSRWAKRSFPRRLCCHQQITLLSDCRIDHLLLHGAVIFAKMIVRIEYFALQKGMGAKSNKENPMLASKEPITPCFIKENIYFNLTFRKMKIKWKWMNVSRKKNVNKVNKTVTVSPPTWIWMEAPWWLSFRYFVPMPMTRITIKLQNFAN